MTYPRWLATAVIVLMGFSVQAAAQRTDIVALDNGDHVTGEIKSLYRGMLTLRTDYMGTLQIEWEHVTELTSKNEFEVELADGQRVYGSLRPTAEESVIEVRGAQTKKVELSGAVEISPFKKSFWEQVTGSTSVGFSFAQSNVVTTWTVAANAGYRTRHYLTTVSFDSYFNNQDGTDSTTRNELVPTVSRFFRDRWFVMGLTQFLQSDELGLQLRTTAGGAVGRHVVQSNKNILSPVGGVVYANSVFLGDTPGRNEILALTGLQYSLFTFGHHKTTLTTAFYVLPSLTDSGHFRLELNSDLRVKLFSDFYWSLSLYENFDNNPPPGGADNDFGVSTSLGWTF